MPPKGRGGKSQKGKTRHFSTPEEIEQGLHSLALTNEQSDSSSISEDDLDSSDNEKDSSSKPKGVSNLIQVENPNRATKSSNTDDGKVQLSRREREEIEKQKAKEKYHKLCAEGKTDQAKADLARLAMIRKQREEAARKRLQEKIRKEEDKMKSKNTQIKK